MHKIRMSKPYSVARLKRILSMKQEHLLEAEKQGDREQYDALEYEIWTLENAIARGRPCAHVSSVRLHSD